MNNNTNNGLRRKPHRSADFLQNKVFILFFLPVIALIIIIAVVLIIRVINPSPVAETPVDAVGDYIYVLPIKERSAGNIPTVGKDPFISEGTTGLVLDGIVYNPNGTSIAIISSVDASYVVSADGSVGKTGWIVTAITADTVTITKNEKSEILSLTSETVAGININDTEA